MGTLICSGITHAGGNIWNLVNTKDNIMNNRFNWRVSGQVNDVGDSPVRLLDNFFGTSQEALEEGWQQDTEPELTRVWVHRVNPHVRNRHGESERVVLTNCEDELRFQFVF